MKIAKIASAGLIVGASMMMSMTNAFAATPSPANANVYIVSPSHGETVSSPVTVVFGVSGMGVAPAGVDKKNTGHHHLIIDAATPNLDKHVPKDANHRHFGGGQTQATIELAPGKHTLQLVFGDKGHLPHNPPVVSKQIEITVR